MNIFGSKLKPIEIYKSQRLNESLEMSLSISLKTTLMILKALWKHIWTFFPGFICTSVRRYFRPSVETPTFSIQIQKKLFTKIFFRIQDLNHASVLGNHGLKLPLRNQFFEQIYTKLVHQYSDWSKTWYVGPGKTFGFTILWFPKLTRSRLQILGTLEKIILFVDWAP